MTELTQVPYLVDEAVKHFGTYGYARLGVIIPVLSLGFIFEKNLARPVKFIESMRVSKVH